MEQPERNNVPKKWRWNPGLITLILSVVAFGLCVLGIMLFLSGCTPQEQPKQAKYVFVFMGDGMGINHVTGTRYLARAELEAEDVSVPASLWREDSFDGFPTLGLMSTHNIEENVTDSSASATAIFTGRKTCNEALNCNPETGEVYTPLASRLSDAGYAVGVISTATLEHASPAAMYAVSEDRYDYTDIALQGLNCGWLDFWAAGDFVWDQEQMQDLAEELGYTVANSPDEIRELTAASLPVVVAAADDAAFPYMAYELDRSRSAHYGADTISLADLVGQAINCFAGQEQFFLFVEAAKVDIASAMLDLKSALYEVRALDDAVAKALEFYEKHPEETLIIVLSDHETGGLRLRTDMAWEELLTQVASGTRFRNIMEELYDADASFEEALEKVEHYFGIDPDDLDEDELDALEDAYQDSVTGDYSSDELDPFTTALCEMKADMAQATFASSSHTAQPVMVYALGQGAEAFAGAYDNTDIFAKLMATMGIHIAP